MVALQVVDLISERYDYWINFPGSAVDQKLIMDKPKWRSLKSDLWGYVESSSIPGENFFMSVFKKLRR